jgi:hypothetical protein
MQYLGDKYDSNTDVASTRLLFTTSQHDGLIAIGSRYIQEFMTQYPRDAIGTLQNHKC